ncbi:MAG: acyl carrier protein [Oscillospiraceae bacterium]
MSTFEIVRATLARQLEIDPELIRENTRIVDDLGVDSLDIVELVMALEERYNIIITNDIVSEFGTVGLIVEFIESHILKRA